jgi:hypothetical protein
MSIGISVPWSHRRLLQIDKECMKVAKGYLDKSLTYYKMPGENSERLSVLPNRIISLDRYVYRDPYQIMSSCLEVTIDYRNYSGVSRTTANRCTQLFSSQRPRIVTLVMSFYPKRNWLFFRVHRRTESIQINMQMFSQQQSFILVYKLLRIPSGDSYNSTGYHEFDCFWMEETSP